MSINSIVGDEFGKNFLSSGNTLMAELEKEGILIFKSFLNSKSIFDLKNEAKELKPIAFSSSSEYNVYVSEYDKSFSDNSPRNRIMKTTKKCISCDLIPKDSLLKKIYNSQKLKKLFSEILNVENLFPYEDSLSSININYYDKGDALGWHFDNSDFTITLLIKNCVEGGIYEFFNNMRYIDGKEDYSTVEKILDKKIEGKKIKSDDGDLMIFKGSKSIHQVTEVMKGERILVTFNYNLTKGISLSEQSRKTFFGRIT